MVLLSRKVTIGFIYVSNKMRKTILIGFLLGLVINAAAQERKWEHSIYAGSGVFVANDNHSVSKPFGLQAGYGLSYFVADRWAIHSGVGIQQLATYGTLLTYLDIPLTMQYHTIGSNNHWTFGLGPVISFCISNDEYNMDNTPDDTLLRKKRFKSYNFGIQPSIAYNLSNHWRIGIDGKIGLMNVKASYKNVSGSTYLHSIMVSMNYLF